MNRAGPAVLTHPAELLRLFPMGPAALLDHMRIMDLTDRTVAPTAHAMSAAPSAERREDHTVLMDRTGTTAHLVIMALMVHTVPAALPAGSDRSGSPAARERRTQSPRTLFEPRIDTDEHEFCALDFVSICVHSWFDVCAVLAHKLLNHRGRGTLVLIVGQAFSLPRQYKINGNSSTHGSLKACPAR